MSFDCSGIQVLRQMFSAKRIGEGRLPSVDSSLCVDGRSTAVSIVVAIVSVVLVPAEIVSAVVVSRAIMPGAGDPNPSVRTI